MREDLYIERKIVSGSYMPDVYNDMLTGFEETELTPLQLAYISERITSYSSDIVFAFAAIAIVGALGTVFSSEPMTDVYDSPTITKQKRSTYYLSICGVNVEVPFECYVRAQEGELITGVLIDVKDRKWFIVCSPAF